MLQANKQEMTTIDKTLLTARLFEGFWDRWIVHGVEKDDLAKIRSSFLTKEQWVNGWQELAIQKFIEAEGLKQLNKKNEAENKFRIAGLYYQLIHWLIPKDNKEKIQWLNESLVAFHQADQTSGIATRYDLIEIENNICFGRIRIPMSPMGVVIIINPLDSTKEELFTYEMDFISDGFITVSFDGPGQGQTYTYLGFKGTRERWRQFIDSLIDYSKVQFPDLPLYLFGTSSGAAWALYGSCNPKVTKVVAVSPAFMNEEIKLPDYFIERTRFVLEEDNVLPEIENLPYRNPVLLVHGKKDVMLSDETIYSLFNKLPVEKIFLEYEEEGHCCNYKLPEIRKISTEWFQGKKEAIL